MDNLSLVHTIAIFPVKLTVVNFQYFWSKWEKKDLIVHIKWFGCIFMENNSKMLNPDKDYMSQSICLSVITRLSICEGAFQPRKCSVLTSVNMLFFLIDDFFSQVNSPWAVVYFLCYSEVYS